MKGLRIGFLALAAAALAVGSAFAFHSGGVAECGGCHSMHSPNPNGEFLLIGSDQSSTCLSCHEHAGDTGPSSYHVSTAGAELGAGAAPKQRGPAGDFGWLKKSYTFTVRGTTTTEAGQTHGHNIVAADNSYVADTDNVTSPGGTFPSAQLGCPSCHNPHSNARRLSDGTFATTGAPIIGSGSYADSAVPTAGQAVGIYRLLGAPGYTQGGVTFNSYAIAVTPHTYNMTENTNQVRTAYGHSDGNGWGNWCATCHGNMHSSGNYVHPVDATLGTDIANIYATYVKSGDLTGTSQNSFLSLVPFAEGTTDFATLAAHAKNDGSYLFGPATSDRVVCLSCHRAHASGFPEMLRWQMEGEFITYNGLWPGTDTTPTVPQFARGRTAAENQAAYYDRAATQFATYQRVLCNKCHAKD